MNYLSGFAEFLLIALPLLLPFLLLIIVIHELGHYWAGRLLGARADAFSIGFGKELFGWNDRHGTRWRIARWPFGGYVKFAGDADVSSKPGADAVHIEGSLESLPIWRRMVVVLAGPAANIVLTLVIFSALFWAFGTVKVKPVVGMVDPDSPAMAAGFEAGDVIVSINDKEMQSRIDVMQTFAVNPLQDFNVQLLSSEGLQKNLQVRPRKVERIDPVTGPEKRWLIGIIFASENIPFEQIEYGPVESVQHAAGQIGFMLRATGAYFGRLVSLQDTPDEIGGIVRIAETSKRYAVLSFSYGDNLGEKFFNAFIQVLNIAAGVSLSIAIVNLLPILPLDGGRFVVYCLEGIIGKSAGMRVQEVAILVGLAFIACLFALVMVNDLVWLTRLFAST